MALFTPDQMAQAVIENAAEYGNPRCAMAEKALSSVGLSWASNAQRFTDVLFLEGVYPQNADGSFVLPAGIMAQARGMAQGSSSCGIFTRALWRYAGVDAAFLYDFYGKHVGKALAQEMAFAQQVGAWRSGMPWVRGTPLPECADAMIMGDNTDAMARGTSVRYQHEGNMMAWIEGPKGALGVCIDGGQPGIEFVLRGFVEVFPGGGDKGELWVSQVQPDGSLPLSADGRPLNGRRLVGYVDVGALPYRDGATPPCRNASSWGELLKWGGLGLVLAGATIKGLTMAKIL